MNNVDSMCVYVYTRCHRFSLYFKLCFFKDNLSSIGDTQQVIINITDPLVWYRYLSLRLFSHKNVFATVKTKCFVLVKFRTVWMKVYWTHT